MEEDSVCPKCDHHFTGMYKYIYEYNFITKRYVKVLKYKVSKYHMCNRLCVGCGKHIDDVGIDINGYHRACRIK